MLKLIDYQPIRGIMSTIDQLEYEDHVLETYKICKKELLSNSLLIQTRSIAHKEDTRIQILIDKKAESPKDQIVKKEITEITLSSLIPTGSKIIMLPNNRLTKLVSTNPFIIRDLLSEDSMFALFEDDVIQYSLVYKDTLLSEGKGTIGSLKIDFKKLKELNITLKNTLILLNFSVISFGNTRKELEKINFLTDAKNEHKNFLKFITSQKFISHKLQNFIKNKTTDPNAIKVFKERLEIYDIDTSSLTIDNMESFLSQIPDHYDFNYDFILDIYGVINNMHHNFSNNFLLNEMDFQKSQHNLEKIINFINEKKI